MTAKDLVNFTGANPRTLDFWVRSKVLEPSIAGANGPGSKREYSMEDVIRCRVAVLLRDMGIETSRIVPILYHVNKKGVDFILVHPNRNAVADIVLLPSLHHLTRFQPNRTAMLIINVEAIRSEYSTLKSE